MDILLPKIEGQPYVYKPFPAWCVGPDGESDVFNSEGDVPAGWRMPDGKTKPGKAAAPAPVAATTTETPPVDGVEVDAAGTPYDPALHAATKGKTKAGLWRMKVGVARPGAAPDAPPEEETPLDL